MSEHSPLTNERPSVDGIATSILTAVAGARGVDAVELPPLYEATDLQAIEDLFRHRRRRPGAVPTKVQFSFAGCDVVVDSDCQIVAMTSETAPDRDPAE